MAMRWSVFATILVLAVALPAAADNFQVINIVSEGYAVDNTESSNSLAITAVGAWKQPDTGLYPTATWVSYDNTGAGGFSPPNGTTATFTRTFVLPYAHNSGSVEVWADDTADVWLDGTLFYAANLGAQNGTCQMGVIGCLPEYGGVVSLNGLTAGSHTLTVEGHQVAGDGFGVLWEGQVTSSAPDGGTTLVLFGGVLVGLETLRRKLRI